MVAGGVYCLKEFSWFEFVVKLGLGLMGVSLEVGRLSIEPKELSEGPFGSDGLFEVALCGSFADSGSRDGLLVSQDAELIGNRASQEMGKRFGEPRGFFGRRIYADMRERFGGAKWSEVGGKDNRCFGAVLWNEEFRVDRDSRADKEEFREGRDAEEGREGRDAEEGREVEGREVEGREVEGKEVEEGKEEADLSDDRSFK